MAKTAVYNWHLDPELKKKLEAVARAEKTSVAKVLERVVGQWLGSQRLAGPDHEPEHARSRLLRVIHDISADHDGPLDSYSRDELRKRVVARTGKGLRRAEPD